MKALLGCSLNTSLGSINVLEHILLNDPHLMKGSRKALSSLLISCGLGSTEHKYKLGLVYGKVFPFLLNEYLNGMREPENSLIHFSVQLFTVSSIISELVMEQSFYRKLIDTIETDLKREKGANRILTKDYTSKLGFICSLLRHIFNDPLLKQQGFFDIAENLSMLINRCVGPLEGMNQQKRRIRTHILFEANEWSEAFSIQIMLGDLIHIFVQNMESRDAIMHVLKRVELNKNEGRGMVSLHSPLIMCASILVRRLYQLSCRTCDFADKIRSLDMPIPLFERSLRVLKMIYEIETGLWVRNGHIKTSNFVREITSSAAKLVESPD